MRLLNADSSHLHRDKDESGSLRRFKLLLNLMHKGFGLGLFPSEVGIDFSTVRMIVRQRCMHLCKRKMPKVAGDLLGTHPKIG